MPRPKQPAGVIVAGGSARRMQGHPKPLLQLRGHSLLRHIIDGAAPQVSQLLLNVSDPRPYREYGLEITRDEQEGNPGPLAGICAAMRWYKRRRKENRLLACFPGDVPLFPDDTVSTLQQALERDNAEVAWLQTGGQLQPLFSLWSMALLPEVEQALAHGVHSPMQFIHSRHHSLVPVPVQRREHYYNVNTPEELAELEAWCKENGEPVRKS